MVTFTLTVSDESALAITASRIIYNRARPFEEHFHSDQDYVQQRLGVEAPSVWYNEVQYAFRIPVGEWLQRWTMPEKKMIRMVGMGHIPGIDAATVAMVAGFLERLDAEPIINLSDPDVINGVPLVCQLLEAIGTIAPGQAADRAAAVNAFYI